MLPSPLERQVVPVRRGPSPWHIAIVASFGFPVFVLFLYTFYPIPPPTVTRVEPAPAPARDVVLVPIAVPHSLPPPPAPAPPPGRAVARIRRYQGIAAPRDQRATLALWTTDEVLLSRDDGASFTPALGGGGEVRGVAFGAGGTLFVLRDQLGVLRSDGRALRRDVPLAGPVHQVGFGGGRVVVIGLAKPDDTRPTVASSANEGRTWTLRELPAWGNDHNEVVVQADGRVDYMGGSEASCGGGHQYHWRGHVDGRDFTEVDWPLDAPGQFRIGPGGWTYAPVACDEPSPRHENLCAVSPAGKAIAVALVRTKDPPEGDLVIGPGVAIWGERLLRVDGAKLSDLARAPGGIAQVTVDAEGRVLGIAEGRALRWAPELGWRELP
jgi:hypothetical protein